MREHRFIGKTFKNLQAHSGISHKARLRTRSWKSTKKAMTEMVFWLIVCLVSGEDLAWGGLLPYKTSQILVLSLPRSLGQYGYVPLTYCRAWRFILRKTVDCMVERMAWLLHLTWFACAYLYLLHLCTWYTCAWEVISHRHLPHVWVVCMINVEQLP